MTAPRFRGSNDVSNPDRHAVDSPRVRDAWDLGLLILGTAAAFLLSRAFARLGGWVMNGHGAAALLRRFWGVLLAVLIDAGAIAQPATQARAIALFALGESGVADTRLLLFLNAFVPRGLQAIRLVIVVLVVALVLDGWRVFDLGAWLASEAGLAAVTTLASILAILVFATLAWIAIASWVDYWLSDNAGSRKGQRWMDRAVCPVRRRPAS